MLRLSDAVIAPILPPPQFSHFIRKPEFGVLNPKSKNGKLAIFSLEQMKRALEFRLNIT